MRFGLGVSFTSVWRIQPELPFGRSGSRTRTHPSGRCSSTRNACGIALSASPFSSHGFGSVIAGAGASGALNTAISGPVAWATRLTPGGSVVVVGPAAGARLSLTSGGRRSLPTGTR